MEFRLLGRIEVRHAERVVPLGGRRQRTVLAHLLVNANRVVPTERLIDAVWGDAPPEAARNALQSYVSRLRTALADGNRIEGRPPGYMLRLDPDELDALRFEALLEDARRAAAGDRAGAAAMLAEALALWRGPPLADLDGVPSLRGEIARLEDLRLAAEEERIAAELALGRHREAVPRLEALVEEHPLRERLWHQLMLALYRCGRQADALAAYRRARRRLAEELGLDPSPELQRLQRQILRQDPGLAPEVERLRGYRLLEQIGAGALGVVHRAVQPHVGRAVAVKVFRPELSNDPRFIRRFEAEAQLVARLEHPRIVPLYDYWREPGAAYLVMRWLRGGNLAAALAGGPLPLDHAVRILDQVSAGLAAAHREGVVHGDVKPANVLLDGDGDAYISDFGIATELAAGMTPPSPDSAAYRSPEQARGEPVTPRSDVYGLGLVLRDALAGTEVPAEVAALIAKATAHDPLDRHADAAAFAAALHVAAGPRDTAVAPAPAARNPYKGLRAFQEADAGDFFGREALTDRLIARLAGGTRLLALVGPSGSGKSSAVRAGLLAALREGRVPGSEDWYLAEMFPGARPFEELATSLLRTAVEPMPDLVEQLERDEHGLRRTARRLLPSGRSELILLVDQLEELFTLADEGPRTRFLASLVAAVLDPGDRIRVVVTLRADYYDRPLEHAAFAELLRTGVETVVPLLPPELERAISLPAVGAGAAVAPGLTAEMVADVSGQPGALPLLQYALTELFERSRDGILAHGDYAAVGGVSGAIARRAEQLCEAAGPSGREAVRQLFLRLVTLDEAGDGTRRRVPRTELGLLEVDQRALEQAIEAFGAHRLLSFDRDPRTREPTVEVAHEALLRVWGRLRSWLDAAREDLRTHQRLIAAAREWEGSGRDPGFLLRGSRLDLFDGWADEGRLSLARPEREFLEASLAERSREQAVEAARRAREVAVERRSLRRLRALVGVLGVAALVAAGLTAFALVQRDRAEGSARVAVARELAAAADANLDHDPERSMLLALEAVERTRAADGAVLPEAAQALQDAVAASRTTVVARGAGGSVAFSPDGRRFVSQGAAGAAGVWDAADGTRRLALGGGVEGVDFGPDGALVAAAGRDGAVTLWDARTGRRVLTRDGGGPLLSAEFSPDGEVMATVTTGGRVRLWDLPGGRLVRELKGWSGQPPIPPEADLLAFGAGGNRLAVVAAAPGPVAARVWDLRTGARVLAVPLDGEFPPHDVDLSPDGARLALAQWNGSVELRDARTGALLVSQPVVSGELWDVDFSPDGRHLATAAGDGLAKVWEVGRHSLRQVLSLGGHATVTDVSFARDGARLLTGSEDGTARIWDIADQGPRALLTLPGTPGQFSGGVAFSPDGRRLVATSRPDRTVRVWDAASGVELLALTGHRDNVHAVAVSPDGTRIVTAGVDSTARAWDAASGRQLWSVTVNDACRALGPLCPAGAAAFSPDGRLVAVGSTDGTARILDAGNGRQLHVLTGHRAEVFSVAFSPDGGRLATASWDGTARVWGVASGRQELTLDPSTEELHKIAFSPRGDRLYTTGFDGTLRTWDAATGRQLRSWPGNQGDLFGLAVSPDGGRLATSGNDGRVKVWDAATGEELHVLYAPGRSFPNEVAFSPDGRRLASSEQFGNVRVWALDIGQLVELARSRVTRALTDQECRQYLHMQACPPGN